MHDTITQPDLPLAGSHATQASGDLLTSARITPEHAHSFRTGMAAGGWCGIAVRTGGKNPIASNWTQGDPAWLTVRTTALNTGLPMRLNGVVAIDLDLDLETDRAAALAYLHAEFRAAGIMPLARFRRTPDGESGLAFLVRCTGLTGNPDIEAPDHHADRKRRIELLTAIQLVVDGTHPSGPLIEWRDGRSPATVPLVNVPEVSAEWLLRLLEGVRVALGWPAPATPGVKDTQHDTALKLGPLPTHLAAMAGPDLNAAAQAGLPDRDWFARLPTRDQNDFLRASFALPAIQALADGSREKWLNLLFGAAHAEMLGATDAREIAEAWSRTSDKFGIEDFSKAWASFDGGRV